MSLIKNVFKKKKKKRKRFLTDRKKSINSCGSPQFISKARQLAKQKKYLRNYSRKWKNKEKNLIKKCEQLQLNQNKFKKKENFLKNKLSFIENELINNDKIENIDINSDNNDKNDEIMKKYYSDDMKYNDYLIILDMLQDIPLRKINSFIKKVQALTPNFKGLSRSQMNKINQSMKGIDIYIYI